MSAAGGSGPSGSAVSQTTVLAVGIIGGLLGIYLSGFNNLIGPILAGLGAVCAVFWGADAIRRVASYGLGTGVPSIGYMSVGVAVIAVICGLGLATMDMFSSMANLISPILVVVLAAILGFVIALLAKKVIKMKIPILEQCTVEICVASALAILGFSSIIAGGYGFVDIVDKVIANGFIAVLYFLVTMGIQHPFNACLGPNEEQIRTLVLAVSGGFVIMTVTGLLSVSVDVVAFGIPLWVIITLIGALGWLIAYKEFFRLSYEQAASVKWTGLWPKVEE